MAKLNWDRVGREKRMAPYTDYSKAQSDLAYDVPAAPRRQAGSSDPVIWRGGATSGKGRALELEARRRRVPLAVVKEERRQQALSAAASQAGTAKRAKSKVSTPSGRAKKLARRRAEAEAMTARVQRQAWAAIRQEAHRDGTTVSEVIERRRQAAPPSNRPRPARKDRTLADRPGRRQQ